MKVKQDILPPASFQFLSIFLRKKSAKKSKTDSNVRRSARCSLPPATGRPTTEARQHSREEPVTTGQSQFLCIFVFASFHYFYCTSQFTTTTGLCYSYIAIIYASYIYVSATFIQYSFVVCMNFFSTALQRFVLLKDKKVCHKPFGELLTHTHTQHPPPPLKGNATKTMHFSDSRKGLPYMNRHTSLSSIAERH